jgi:hypothetical protein
MNRNEYWQAMALHSPEGVWKAIAERRPLALSFNPDLVSSIAIVKLKKLTKTGHDADYIITSAAGSIYMYTSALEVRGFHVGNAPSTLENILHVSNGGATYLIRLTTEISSRVGRTHRGGWTFVARSWATLRPLPVS